MTAQKQQAVEAQSTAFELPTPKYGHTLAPSDSPEDCYAMRLDGDCMEPLASHGSYVLLERQLPKKGEMACFWFEDAQKPALKILNGDLIAWPIHNDSNLVPIIKLKQLNPPTQYTVMGDVVSAIHRVWAVQDNETGEWMRMEALND